MTIIEIVKYCSFGFSFLVGLIIFSFQNDLLNPKIYSKAFLASFISFLVGVVFEVFNLFNMEPGMTLLVMSIGLIYVLYFKLFVNIFIRWQGTTPIITSTSSKVGGKPIGGFWIKYPPKRKIMFADFIFSFTQGLIPIFTIAGLIALLRN